MLLSQEATNLLYHTPQPGVVAQQEGVVLRADTLRLEVITQVWCCKVRPLGMIGGALVRLG